MSKQFVFFEDENQKPQFKSTTTIFCTEFLAFTARVVLFREIFFLEVSIIEKYFVYPCQVLDLGCKIGERHFDRDFTYRFLLHRLERWMLGVNLTSF